MATDADGDGDEDESARAHVIIGSQICKCISSQELAIRSFNPLNRSLVRLNLPFPILSLLPFSLGLVNAMPIKFLYFDTNYSKFFVCFGFDAR